MTTTYAETDVSESLVMREARVANERSLSVLDELQSFDAKAVSKKLQDRAGMIGTGILALLFIGFAADIILGIFAFVLAVIALIGTPLAIKFIRSKEVVLLERWKNEQMKALVAETRKNAIDSLRNHLVDESRRIKQAEEDLIEMEAIKMEVIQQCDKFTKMDNVDEGLIQQTLEMKAMVTEGFDAMVEELSLARAAYKEFDQKVTAYIAFDKVASLVNTFMGKAGEKDKLREMLSIEAFTSIDSKFNTAMARVNASSRKLRDAKGKL